MPADPIHPGQLGEARFRADLVPYVDTLPAGELAGRVGSAAGVSIRPSGPSRVRLTSRSTIRPAM
jgi:hypothetical protein